MRVAILTISDAGARGERAGTSGDAIERWARSRGDEIAARALVPDESTDIVATVMPWCDEDRADLVLTTGGTGLSARDVTPEATRALLEREAPGIAERIRVSTIDTFPTVLANEYIQGLKTNLAQLQRDQAQLSERYLKDHPEMIKINFQCFNTP